MLEEEKVLVILPGQHLSMSCHVFVMQVSVPRHSATASFYFQAPFMSYDFQSLCSSFSHPYLQSHVYFVGCTHVFHCEYLVVVQSLNKFHVSFMVVHAFITVHLCYLLFSWLSFHFHILLKPHTA